MDEKNTEIKTDKKSNNGNACLLGGAALGTFGTTMALGANFVCPVCMIGTPVLLGIGAVQKYKFLKNKPTAEKTSSED